MMPGFDGTGPAGMGPRTGGGFGYCAPGAVPAPGGYAPGVGRGGFPRGGGRGRAFGGGRGWWGKAISPYAAPTYPVAAPYPAAAPFDEKGFLENQVASLEQQLTAIKNRLTEIGTQETED